MIEKKNKKNTDTLNDNVLSLSDAKSDEKIYKELPCNIQAERHVLGIFLNNNENVNKVSDFLLPQSFYLPIHTKIYSTILKFMDMGLVANPVTLHNFFKSDDVFKKLEIDSIEYLSKLCADAAIPINVIDYSKSIYDSYIRRNLITIASDIFENAYKEDIDQNAVNQIELAEQDLFDLASKGEISRGSERIGKTLDTVIDKIAISMKRGTNVIGVTTGYKDLNSKLGGMQDSDLIILAARPSMGKTSLAINIALNAAVDFLKKEKKEEKKKSVVFFSLEMSSEQVATRFLAIKTEINSSNLRVGNLSKDEFLQISKASVNLNKLPIFIDDTPALSISALRTRARRLKRQNNIGILIVDYLQLLRGVKAKSERVQEIGEITQGLKAIAKELNIPVIALSQLSRAVESRDDKRPQLSDLRESGNIEQDADIVMFIYRDEYYVSRKKPAEGSDDMISWQLKMDKVKNIADIIIAKQRNGPIGSVSLMFDNDTTGFKDLYKPNGIEA